jgi:single-strand DNA-binding protein
MASVNKAIIVGNLGKDPEVRYTASGEAMCNITVATSENWKDKAHRREEGTDRMAPHFVLREAGRNLRPVPEKRAHRFMSKAASVRVNGLIKNGQERYTTEIKGDEMKMLGSRQGMGAPVHPGGGGYDNEPTDYAPAPAKNKPKPSFDDLGDDIPF